MASPNPTFESFFVENRDRLFRVLCVMCASRHDAEELAQDAFLKMWERWDSVASLDDTVAYLYRIAINGFRKRLRRAEVAKRLTRRSPESTPTTGEDAVLLDEALSSLTPRQRAALVLTEVLGYSADEAAKELGVKPSTIGALKYQGRALLKDQARNRDDCEWVAGMRSDGLSPSRVRQAFVVLNAILELAVRHGRLGRNPARGTDLPSIRRKEAPYLDPATVDAIAGAVPDRYSLFVAIQGVLGLRFGEAVALRRSSVDIMHRRLRVSESATEINGRLVFGPTKSHAARAVPLPPSILGAFEAHLEENVAAQPEALVFTSPHGSPIRYRNFTGRVWAPTLRSLGLPEFGMHVLRHSAASRMIRAGWTPKAVQKALGHASAGFTMTVYAHLFDDDLDELATALDAVSRRTNAVQNAGTPGTVSLRNAR